MTEFDSRDRDQELHELFARIESRPLSSTIFLYHAAISVFVVPISGLLTFWLTPFTGAILGIDRHQTLAKPYRDLFLPANHTVVPLGFDRGACIVESLLGAHGPLGVCKELFSGSELQ